MKPKYCKLVSLFIAIVMLYSCSSDGTAISEDSKVTSQINNPTQLLGNSFEVIFFDIDNDISDDGKSYVHLYGTEDNQKIDYKSVKPADCYLVKAGNTEILVDAGYQNISPSPSTIVKERIKKIYDQKVIPQIKKHCEDGILEYFIITHGDFDHIIAASIDGGLLDDKEGSLLGGENSLKLLYLIDFDSDLVRNYNIVTSDIVESYRKKRDVLVNAGKVKHIPAAVFFKESINKEDTDLKEADLIIENNTFVNSMPNTQKKKLYRTDTEINGALIGNFVYCLDGLLLKYEYDAGKPTEFTRSLQTYKSHYSKTTAPENGELKLDNDRYYYSIPIDRSMELRILYNWSYNHFYNHNVDSQDKNNISVCFEVVCDNSKFVSFGDLGYGESGVIEYYKNTSLLKNVSCFKASHHGSTTNGENSSELFNLMKPDIVVIPGVAQINCKILKKMGLENDPIYNGLQKNAVIEKEFFENVKNARKGTQIYCTQIVHFDSDTGSSFISAPFCGDIYISIGTLKTTADCSYKGEINSYIYSSLDENKFFTFFNTKNKKPLCFSETEYWERLYSN